uniref:Uncharacterized protein n=1 Tax=Pipistrellus kuhlii TaxID=59472 RepID=A0A7J7UTG8_PIPKU|nr:hypothetical protein mPipKuh1_008690 [Pipistrellus kuhlii]
MPLRSSPESSPKIPGFQTFKTGTQHALSLPGAHLCRSLPSSFSSSCPPGMHLLNSKAVVSTLISQHSQLSTVQRLKFLLRAKNRLLLMDHEVSIALYMRAHTWYLVEEPHSSGQRATCGSPATVC